jgi:uncharacterized protein YbjT (DUF2867 family)
MKTITIFGGSGFVGRSLVQKLADRGDRIRIAVRNPIAAESLKPLGEVGQITLVQASLTSEKEISKAIEGADIVINLVGILFETGSQTFDDLHEEGAKRVAKAASKLGVSTLLHMSAIGANKDSKSRYASSKARGEKAVLKHFPQATILRPSIIFGPQDAFLNRFAEMAVFSPFLPLIGGGKTRTQPIYVQDVADCFIQASLNKDARGKIYELGGPTIYTVRELMEYILTTIHRKRLLLPLPFFMAKIMATFAQLLPTPPLTRDQVELLKSDNVVSSHALKAEDLKVRPKAMETLAPQYLERYSPTGHFHR